MLMKIILFAAILTAVLFTGCSNNKVGKASIIPGYIYDCISKNSSGDSLSLKLKAVRGNPNFMLTAKHKKNGKPIPKDNTAKFEHHPDYGFVGVVEGSGIIQMSTTKPGRIAYFRNKKELAAEHGIIFQCTQVKINNLQRNSDPFTLD